MKNLYGEITKEHFYRSRASLGCEYLVVDVETYELLKVNEYFVPASYQQDLSKGDTFIGLKVSIRYDVDFGWRIA